jgi:hypothetical protein
MANPLKSTTVVTEAVGDGLGVFDPEQRKSYVLNATSALVFERCDGETTPRQLTELLRQKFNVAEAQAAELLRLALDELQTAGLLAADAALPPPSPRRTTRTARRAAIPKPAPPSATPARSPSWIARSAGCSPRSPAAPSAG